MSGRIYERLLGVIGTDRVAIAPDTPGFGQSDAPATPPEIADYAEAIGAGLDALNVVSGSIDIVGYHTGSMIAVEMAHQRPTRIRRLVLIAAPIFTDTERGRFREQYGFKVPALDGSHLVAMWQDFCHYHLGPDRSLEQVADSFPEVLLGRRDSWWGHRAAFNYEFAQRLSGVTQPVLILNPADDLWDYTPRAAEYVRNGRIVDLPAWCHGFLDSHTADAAQLLRNFLDAPTEAVFDRLLVACSAQTAPLRPAAQSVAPRPG